MKNQVCVENVNHKNMECYFPYQPDFEQKLNYQNFPVHKGHPLWGIVSDFFVNFVEPSSVAMRFAARLTPPDGIATPRMVTPYYI